MQFEALSVPGSHLIHLEPIDDSRGSFARAFSVAEFAAVGLITDIRDINIARSVKVGTVRGIHWQVEPDAEAKVVRCTRGRIFDVCVDIRLESPTWGHWAAVELSEVNRRAIYVPPGCGHAYQTLEPDTEVLYTTSAAYAPQSERGARWNDPAFGIEWPLLEDLTISEKDLTWPDAQRP